MKKPFTPEEIRAKWKPLASAKNNGDFISVEAYSGYLMALADPQATEFLLNPEASDEELGRVTLEALKQSRFLSLEEATELRVNASESYKNWVAKLMAQYGYKTKRALFKTMKNCDIVVHGEIIKIEPTFHEKLEAWDGEGFTEEDYVKVPVDASPEDIGAALRLAFSRCTGMGA